MQLIKIVASAWFILSGIGVQAHELPLVQVHGNKFITPDNQVVVFKGVSASDPFKLQEQGHWDKAYFTEIKKWGANIVRLPVHPANWRALGNEAYCKLLDAGIQWATELQLYIIIDWHSIGNLQTGKFFRPSYHTTQDETNNFWRTMAKRYGRHTTVAFFELFNEPVKSGEFGECSWLEWKTLQETMISIIRGEGATTVPLVAGFNWGYDLIEAGTNPIDATGIGYVSHPYPMKRDKPWAEKWTTDWGFMAAHYPVILTEIGFSGHEEKGAHIPVISDELYGEAIVNYCNAKGISYTVWCFDPDWAPMLISDWQFNVTRQGKFFKQTWLKK
ncbi:MAG: cellulase family glycosylhydrolase [Cyclobacteriaceae bacterium]|nr:cellulase family glycosylhydrolase [Cyclobacteriaceae bacterium]